MAGGPSDGLDALEREADTSGDRGADSATQPCPLKKKKTFIAVQLVGEDGSPVPDEPFAILLPDGTRREGTLDGSGKAIVEGLDPGTCSIQFPALDKDAWEPI